MTRYVQLIVDNIPALQNTRGNDITPLIALMLGPDYPITEAVTVFEWQDASTATEDLVEVVTPVIGPSNGRWHKVNPATQPQVNPDWSASSGPAQILNKPVIPAAQTPSDWNATAGVSRILNKPTIPAAQVQSDWQATSGAAQILNKPAIPAAQVPVDWNASSGVQQILNKPSIPSYNEATTSTAGLLSASDKAKLNGLKSIQATRAQTDSAGVFTWTFPVPFPSGTVPVIECTVEDNTSATWNHQITSLSNTAVSIRLTKTTAVTLLGISILGLATNPQAYVHLTAVAP